MIRAVSSDDWSRLEQLWLEVICNSHPSLPRAYWEAKRNAFRQSCLEKGKAWVYLDAESGEANGFAALSDDNQLATLFVAPWARDRGAGSALMAQVKHERPLLWVVLLEENLEARYFCQKHQFEEVDREPCPETGQDRLLMEFRCD